MKFDDIAASYIKLRDAKAELEREHEEILRPIKEAMEAAEQSMLGKLNEMGVKSIRTDFGTITKATKTSVTVGNWDAVFGFVKENEFWHFLEHRISKTAVEGYISEHDEPPPGVNLSRVATIQFRRS